jgi:hypothetical protein
MKSNLFSVLILGLAFTACNSTAGDRSTQPQTPENVQKVIDELGLVYVEEGAQDIITYDEVNAAQQAWCDALVEIGRLYEAGGDYKGFASEV